MTQEQKHTALPLLTPERMSDADYSEGKYYKGKPHEYLTICFPDGNYAEVHGDNQEANAQFIVTACNSHYGLLGLLKRTLPSVKKSGLHGLYDEMLAVIEKAEGK